MKKLIIKVCGMRKEENIKEVEALDIDFMGFIFYEKSPRFVVNKPKYLPIKVQRVGVFVDEEIKEIILKVKEYGLNYIQLHGSENKEFCQSLKEELYKENEKVGIIKAFSICSKEDLIPILQFEPYVNYFLFDTPTTSRGGSGKHFNWEILNSYKGKTPFLLSGGIGPMDVTLLKEFHHEYLLGIDLNSKFETSPAKKDSKLLSKFINEVKQEID